MAEPLCIVEHREDFGCDAEEAQRLAPWEAVQHSLCCRLGFVGVAVPMRRRGHRQSRDGHHRRRIVVDGQGYAIVLRKIRRLLTVGSTEKIER